MAQSKFGAKTLTNFPPGYRIAERADDTRGYHHIHMIYRNAALNIADGEEDFHSQSGTWVPPTQARIHEISSTSIFDDVGSQGANSIRIYGVDENGKLAQEDIIMNGGTAVDTVNSYLHIYLMETLGTETSTWGPNAGRIDATAKTDGTLTCNIQPGYGYSQISAFLVPTGMTAYMTQISCNISRSVSGGIVDVNILERPSLTDEFYKRKFRFNVTQECQYWREFTFPMRFDEGTYIKMSGVTTADGVEVVGDYELLLTGKGSND